MEDGKWVSTGTGSDGVVYRGWGRICACVRRHHPDVRRIRRAASFGRRPVSWWSAASSVASHPISYLPVAAGIPLHVSVAGVRLWCQPWVQHRVFCACRRGAARDGNAGEANRGNVAAAAREPGEATVHVDGEGTKLPRRPMEPPAPCHSYASRVGRSRPKSVHVRRKEHANEDVEHGSVGEGGRSCGRDGHGHSLGEGDGCGIRSERGQLTDDGLEALAALLQEGAGLRGATAARLRGGGDDVVDLGSSSSMAGSSDDEGADVGCGPVLPTMKRSRSVFDGDVRRRSSLHASCGIAGQGDTERNDAEETPTERGTTRKVIAPTSVHVVPPGCESVPATTVGDAHGTKEAGTCNEGRDPTDPYNSMIQDCDADIEHFCEGGSLSDPDTYERYAPPGCKVQECTVLVCLLVADVYVEVGISLWCAG